MAKHKRYLATLLIGALGVLCAAAGIPASAQDVTQGYQATGPLQNGMIVRLKPDAADTVEPLTQEVETTMLGVIVANSEAPVSLSDPNKQQVFVANFGQYSVLVSTQNGTIKSSDLLVISSVKGVAMKADGRHQVVVGKALQGFSEGSNAESHISLAGSTFAVGRILVDISISRNPTYNGDIVAGVPTFLAKLARLITDRPVTALRLYVGLVALGVALLVAGFVLYVGVRSGMSAVGRNPLARKSIWRGLFSVTLIALIVVITGIIAVYLILKI